MADRVIVDGSHRDVTTQLLWCSEHAGLNREGGYHFLVGWPVGVIN